MTSEPDTVIGAAPFLHGVAGTGLLAIGAVLFLNLNEGQEFFLVLTVVFSAPGLYLLIAGAVARGIALARTIP